MSGRDKANETACRSDQACVHHSYESEESPGWLLRLSGLCADDPAKTVRTLTGALLACGSWVLTRTHEKAAFAIDFEFARRDYVPRPEDVSDTSREAKARDALKKLLGD